MGKSELVDKILSDGRSKAEQVEADCRQSLAEVSARTDEEVRRLEEEHAAKLNRDTGIILERARSSVRLNRRNALLGARWQVLDKVMSEAGRRLLADPGYPELVSGLVRRFAGPDSEVRLSEPDTQRFGKKLSAKLGQPAAIDGGVKIRSGRSELDFTPASSLAQLREELAAELSAILFAD
jgi:V/A-type H+-transporting ATPase subunit E